MASHNPLDPAIHAAIVADLEGGMSCRAVAQRHGISSQRVSVIGIRAGVSLSAARRAKSAALHAARREHGAWDAVRRLETLDRAFDRLDALLGELPDNPAHYHQWSIAWAILTDKARLERGDATSIIHRVTDDAYQAFRAQLLALAARQLTSADPAPRALPDPTGSPPPRRPGE